MRTKTLLIASAAVLLALPALAQTQATPAAPADAAATTAPAAAAAAAPVQVLPDVVLGEASAPVTVVEYASFTCPHCAAFHDENFPKLKAEYIDTGKVRFIQRDVYFDQVGLWAGVLERRTKAGWEVHDALATGVSYGVIGERLGISQSAVSQRARAAGIVDERRARALVSYLWGILLP